MYIRLPFVFTDSGRGWYKRSKKSPTFVNIQYDTGLIEKINTLQQKDLFASFRIVSGSGSCNGYFEWSRFAIRITNIVGYDHEAKDFLKQCPQCGFVGITSHFDYEGRVTDMKRDQSNCMNCRGSYRN